MVQYVGQITLSTILFLVVSLSTAQTITRCPSAVSSGTSTNGFTYRICSSTDYQGESIRIINGVASVRACAQLCADDQQCVKAVYDKAGSVCHLKTPTGALTLVINKCPYTETTYTTGNGAKYQVCAGTDYEGPTRQAIENIASSTDCNQLCGRTDGCTKSVFDTVANVCHIKDDQGNLVWATNRRFVASRLQMNIPASSMGKWSDIINLPVIPVAGYMVPQQPETSRMLFFSSFQATNFGGAHGYTQFGDYNYKTGAVSQRQVSNTQHDMFCPGISQLADGRILITGGSDAQVTSIYNPATNAFVREPDMKIARGYQTSATLSNGKVFTIGGSYSGGIGGKMGEIYDPTANTWTRLSGADVNQMLTTYDGEGAWRTDNHAWLFGWRNGAVFQAGPSRDMHWFDTAGQGSVTNAGTRDPDSDAMCGVYVMYDVGKIFAAGGTQSYTNSPALTRAYLISIDNPNTAAAVERLPDMSYGRGFGNAVVLPDGTVLVTGGQMTARVFTDTEAVLVAESFDPTTKTFKKLTSAAVPRNYHSISLLLPDATVMTAGGGLCYNPHGDPNAGCDRSADHSNGEIFSPPYLFNADGSAAIRPVISSVSSSTASNGYKARVGGTLRIRMRTTAATSFSLIRMGSVTHSINSDQRRIPLTNVQQSGSTHTASLASDSGVLLPGFYYLFAVSTTGTPSIARIVQITI